MLSWGPVYVGPPSCFGPGVGYGGWLSIYLAGRPGVIICNKLFVSADLVLRQRSRYGRSGYGSVKRRHTLEVVAEERIMPVWTVTT